MLKVLILLDCCFGMKYLFDFAILNVLHLTRIKTVTIIQLSQMTRNNKPSPSLTESIRNGNVSISAINGWIQWKNSNKKLLDKYGLRLMTEYYFQRYLFD